MSPPVLKCKSAMTSLVSRSGVEPRDDIAVHMTPSLDQHCLEHVDLQPGCVPVLTDGYASCRHHQLITNVELVHAEYQDPRITH